MKREEFNKLYPDCDLGENEYTKVTNIKVSKGHVVITQEIDLTHPNCPIIKWEEPKPHCKECGGDYPGSCYACD